MSEVVRGGTKVGLAFYHGNNVSQDLQFTSPNNKLWLSMICDCSEIQMKKGPNGGPLERRSVWIRGGSFFEMGSVVHNRNILKHVFEGVTYHYMNSIGGYQKVRESFVNLDDLVLTKVDNHP